MSENRFFQNQKNKRLQEIASITEIIQTPISFGDESAYCKSCKTFSVVYRLVQAKKRDEAETAIYQCRICDQK